MNKTHSKMVLGELEEAMSTVLVWIDEHLDHDVTPAGVEKQMASAALSVLEAAWDAFKQGKSEDD